jgi:hypothetical protein
MLGILNKREQRRKEDLRYAILDGEIRALRLVMGSMITLMPSERREALIELLKTVVGQGFTSDSPGLTGEAKQMYNDSLSMVLQNFIEGTQKSPSI